MANLSGKSGTGAARGALIRRLFRQHNALGAVRCERPSSAAGRASGDRQRYRGELHNVHPHILRDVV
jgi:hypothetical protein